MKTDTPAGRKPSAANSDEANAETSVALAPPVNRLAAVGWGLGGVALLLGWFFVYWHHRYHVTPAMVMFCLAWLAVLAAGYYLWRTGAEATTQIAAWSDWWQPTGTQAALELEKRSLLKAIKEIEFDEAMGKHAQGEAKRLASGYRTRAIQVIKALETLEAQAEAAGTLTVREQIEREVALRKQLAPKVRKVRATNAAATPPASDAAAATPAPSTEPVTSNADTPAPSNAATPASIGLPTSATASLEAAPAVTKDGTP